MTDGSPTITPSMSLVSGIRASMLANPEKVAITDSQGSRSYAELVFRIDKITSGFITDLKLPVGSHAAIVANNSIEYLEVVCGASQAGVALATINPALSADEITAICDDADARVLFTDDENFERLQNRSFHSIEKIIKLGSGIDSWVSNADSTTAFPEVSERDVFTIPYTSGTTGRPKGVLVSHRSRVLTLHGMALEYGCYSNDDRFLAIAPLCHGAGMVFGLASLYFGGYVRLMNRFDPESVLSILHHDSMTGVFMVPTHFHGIFALSAGVLDKYRDTNLRSIISNAAPLPQVTKERIIDYFGDNLLHETYGSTEAGIVSNLPPADQLNKRNCVGLPFDSTRISLRNESGDECGPEEPGELFSISPYLFNGYWKNQAETDAAFMDGWVSVGDIARRDADGYLYIIDRKKDMVISGGTNIYPREIENVLEQHPTVTEAGVVGVPDEKWGERLKAFVVISDEGSFAPDQIVSFAESRLAKYKVPKDFEVISRLPRNANGKVLKAILRARTQPSIKDEEVS